MHREKVNIVFWLIAIVICQFLYSCNTSVEIAKRHYQSGYYVSIHKKHNDTKLPNITKVAKEHLQCMKSITLKLDNNVSEIIESHTAILNSEFASTDNSTPIINKSNSSFTNSDILTVDNFVSSANKQNIASKSFSNGGGDVSYYFTRWAIYLGLSLLAIFAAILLSSTTALGFSYLLFVIGGVLLLLAIIYFIKWVSFL